MDNDKIIKDVLKKNSKRDILDYCLAGFFFLMIFVPPIFKVVFRDSSVKVEKESIVFLTYSCRKAVYIDDGQVTTVITNEYKDGTIQSFSIKFGYSEEKEDTIPELKTLIEANLDNKVVKEKTSTGYTFTFDFVKYPELKELEVLKNYNFKASAMQDYSSQGFYCEKSSRVVEEEIK